MASAIYFSGRKLSLSLLILSFMRAMAGGQVIENFNDGDFTNNPSWAGNVSDWIVNASGQLQSNNTVAGSHYYLSTASSLASMAQWEFWCRLSFNPSSLNYVDVFLTASAADVTLGNTTGYFVRIGNSNDEISLYRKNANGSNTLIIDGTDGILNSSNNVMKVKVARDASNRWVLFRDLTGTGNNYSAEGSVTDATFATSGYFGIWVHQSTASFFQRHFFDDIRVTNYVPDLAPPVILSARTTDANRLDILFDEPVEQVSSQDPANYFVDNGTGNPLSALRDASNNALVHLSFGSNFPGGIPLTVTINGVQDLSGNAVQNGSSAFLYYAAQRYDVVIDEIMADPSPPRGLPNEEWIELKNTSPFPIRLQGWRFRDAAGSSGPMPDSSLLPDSFLIVCSPAGASQFPAFGNIIAVSGFPSLDNEGDTLSLQDNFGKTIHAVAYDRSWYRNELKKDGGWTLEMMDPGTPCAGSDNWKASIDPGGGTPGKKNSLDGLNTDQNGPRLKRGYTLDSVTIILVFDEPLDSLSGSTLSNYGINGNITLLSARALPPLFNNVQLKTAAALTANTVYTVTASAVMDCESNSIGSSNKTKVGLPADPSPGEWIINEILFNPRPGAYDFIEFFNNSQKIFDASKLYIANRNSSGLVSSIVTLSAEPFFIFPGDYLVVTEDADNLSLQYLVSSPGQVLALSSLPSFPDDKGCVIALNLQGSIVDEVNYRRDWHFQLLQEEEGISLERIDPAGPSGDPANWHSAASTAGYGTPSYRNSQYRSLEAIHTNIVVTPKIFSPDNDGRDDVLTIQYEVGDPGYVANITIFDAPGRPVRYLVRNGTLGLKGNWNWDGLDERGRKLPVGIYIVYAELFNLQGKVERLKKTVVLAGRMN